jgi:hypothetical protein
MSELTEVLLRCDPHDGNELMEAEIKVPFVPRIGDSIELWDKDGGFRNTNGMSGESLFPTVEMVVWCGYAPDRIEVWLRFDGFNLEQVRRVMEGTHRGDQP